jgi:hypothetical protein
VWGNTLAYQVGYFNGVEDGGSGDIEVTDDGKDPAARLFVHPFDKAEIEPLKKLGLGVSATHGIHMGALRNYSSGGQQTWFRWRTGAGTAAAPNVTGDGDVSRISPQGYWYWRPFGLFGEYLVSSHEVTRRAGVSVAEGKFRNTAWQVAASYFSYGRGQFLWNRHAEAPVYDWRRWLGRVGDRGALWPVVDRRGCISQLWDGQLGRGSAGMGDGLELAFESQRESQFELRSHGVREGEHDTGRCYG